MSEQELKYRRYNAIDGAVTYQVWERIKDDIDKTGQRPFYDQTMDLLPVLMYMSARGIKVNKEALEETRNEVLEKSARLKQQLNEMAGRELNTNSPKQCVEYFYGHLGLQPYKNSAGNPTVDDKALTRIARRGYREASLLQEIRALDKLRGTYLDAIVDSDGRLRSSFNPRGTTTGRLSSSQTIFGTGLNFQNLHPAFKKFMVADEGYTFYELDKRQAEWVITAFMSGDASMMRVCNEGMDPHTHTAHLMTGLPKELIEKEHKLLSHETDPYELERQRREHFPEMFQLARFLPRTMTCRQAGKKSNHGLNYRMGYRRFALENEMEENEAKPLVEAYSGSAYITLPAWWDSIEGQLRLDRTVTNCFGRRRSFMGPIDKDLVMAAIAYGPQSTNGDLVNQALIKMFNCPLSEIDILCQVHDSILIQLPDSLPVAERVETLRVIQGFMEPTLRWKGREFHVATDLKVGKNWGSISETNPQGMRELDLSAADDELMKALTGAFTNESRA